MKRLIAALLLVLTFAAPAAALPLPNANYHSYKSDGVTFQFLSTACGSGTQGVQPPNCAPQADGTGIQCKDCSATIPCTAGGAGAMAYHENGSWNCATGAGTVPANALIQGQSGAVLQDLTSDIDGFLTPKAHGVLCDGSDDTAHVQALLDLEKAAPKGTTILWGPCIARTTAPLFFLQSANNTQGLNILGAGRIGSGLDCQIPTAVALTPGDGVTNGTTTVTSASSNFTNETVLNATIAGTDIPTTVVPVVQKVIDAHTLVLSQSATGSHSGIIFTITPIKPCLMVENTSVDGSHVTWGAHIADFGITSTAGAPDYGIYNKFVFQAVYERMRIRNMAKDGIHLQSDVGDVDAQVNTTVIACDLWTNSQWGINSSCPLGTNLSSLWQGANSFQQNLFGALRFMGSGLTSVGNSMATNGDNVDGHGGWVFPYGTASTLQVSSLGDDWENNTPRHIDMQTCLRCSFEGPRFRSSVGGFPTSNGIRICDDNLAGACQGVSFTRYFVSIVPSFAPYTLFQLGGGSAAVSGLDIEYPVYQQFNAAGQQPFSDPTVANLTDLVLTGSKAWKANKTTIPVAGWNGNLDLEAIGGTPPYYNDNVAVTASGDFALPSLKGAYDGRRRCVLNASGHVMTVIPGDAGRTKADYVENNTTTVTSATAAFVAATDVGRPATGTSIPATTLTNAIALPQATIPVTSTTGFANGAANIGIAGQVIACTGTDATDFTGCTGGVGAVANGAAVNTVVASVTNATTAVLSEVATNNSSGNTVTLGGSSAANRIWDSALAPFAVGNDGSVCFSYATVAGAWLVTGTM